MVMAKFNFGLMKFNFVMMKFNFAVGRPALARRPCSNPAPPVTPDDMHSLPILA